MLFPVSLLKCLTTLVFHIHFRLQTSTLLGESHKPLLWESLHLRFTYSYQESCNLYPRCTLHFSVEHTVSCQSADSNSSSACSVRYTIHNLMRCVSYQSTSTVLLGNQRETSLLWEAQSCKVSDCNWSEGGGASRLDLRVSIYFIQTRTTPSMSNGHT